MKNISNQKSTRKVKPSVKPTTESMLNMLENQAARFVPKQKRKTKLEQRNARISIILATSVAFVILCVLGFFAIRSSMTTEANKRHFVDIRQTVSSVRDQLNAMSPNNIQWLQNDECHYWTSKDWSSGWNCSTGVSLEVNTDEVDIQNLITLFDNVLTSSDGIRFEREGNKAVNSQIYDYNPKKYIVEGADIGCDAGLIAYENEDTASNVRFSFVCSGGAQKSWYPNSEAIKDESLRPGVNAWKGIE